MQTHHYLYGLILLLCCSACSNTRFLAEEEALYVATDFDMQKSERLENESAVESLLMEAASPQPNTLSFGFFRLKLWFYNRAGEPKGKGLRYWMKEKIGEPAVLYEEEKAKRSAEIMEKRLQDRGYFNAFVSYRTSVKQQKARTTYVVQTQGRSRIQRVFLPDSSDAIGRIIHQSQEDSKIKAGAWYDLGNLVEERNRLNRLIRDAGYFDFTPNYLYYYVDSLSNQWVDIYLRVQPPAEGEVHRAYQLNQLYLYPQYSIESGEVTQDTTQYADYQLIQTQEVVRAKALDRVILLDTSEYFSLQKHEYTAAHLQELGMFKFVNIRYKKPSKKALLDAHIYLTPATPQEVTAEFELNTRTGNFLGSSIRGTYIHNNLLKGAERLNASLTIGAETLPGDTVSFINTIDFAPSVSLELPRFLFPFISPKISRHHLPKTNIVLSSNFQRRLQFYTINSANIEFGYDWKPREGSQHQLNPISISRVNVFQTTTAFDSLLSVTPSLQASFRNTSILGSTYRYTHSTKSSEKRHYTYWMFNADVAGNFLYSLMRVAGRSGRENELLGLPFAQYAKADVDVRQYWQLGKTKLVGRLNVGAGIPYGNSSTLPFIKQYFTGGTTSIRAFRLRTLGPGTYSNRANLTSGANFLDQSGDLKLEMNLEYRFGLVSVLKGAMFVDAGNIWLLKEDDSRPGGQISSDFYREMAVGVGLGFRIDLSLFVLRLDAAVPIRTPYLEEDNRWIADFRLFKKSWRQQNLVWNLAIGYPF